MDGGERRRWLLGAWRPRLARAAGARAGRGGGLWLRAGPGVHGLAECDDGPTATDRADRRPPCHVSRCRAGAARGGRLRRRGRGGGCEGRGRGGRCSRSGNRVGRRPVAGPRWVRAGGASEPARGRAPLKSSRAHVRGTRAAGEGPWVHRQVRAFRCGARRAAGVSKLLGVLAWPAALVLGLAAEAVAFAWGQPRLWVPDLAVGLAFFACGRFAWEWHRGAAALFVATGVTWFAGTAFMEVLFLHRGPLANLLLGYPGARPRSRIDGAGVAAGYAVALAGDSDA